jgi:AbrB family looped-hinge helix DNA binding protein
VKAVTLNARGQVTIPKQVRDFLGLGPRSEVRFEINRSGEVVIRPVVAKVTGRSPLAKLRGTATVRMSTEEIMALTRGS